MPQSQYSQAHRQALTDAIANSVGVAQSSAEWGRLSLWWVRQAEILALASSTPGAAAR